MAAGIQIASLYAAIGADLSGLTKGLKTAQGKLKSAGGAIAKTGGIMTAGITLPLLALGKKVVGVAADFESGMNVLDIAAKASGTSLKDLQEAAIAVGGDTELVGINAAEAAGAMTEFYKAGLSTTDIFGDLNAYMEEGAGLSGALRAAIDLQAASELDLARASDVVSIAMATFGLDAGDATGIADNFVRTADASVASVGELADAMINVGPTAAAFGWGMEDVNIGLALLSQRGIKGAEAGTALKSMMTNLMRPTDKTKAALENLNVSLYDAQGAMYNLPEIMAQLESGMNGLTEAQRNEAVQTLAGTYGMKAMNTLLAEGSEGWQGMESAIASASSVQESAAARTQGINAAWETLSGVIETFMIKAGTPLIELLNELVRKHLIPFAETLAELDPKIILMGVGILAAAAAAGPFLAIMGGVLSVVGLLVSPIGLIVAGMVALAVAFVKSQGGIEGAKKKLEEIWKTIKAKLGPVVEGFKKIWATAWKKIKSIVDSVLNAVVPFIKRMVADAIAFFKSKFQFIISWFQENLPLIQATVETILNAIQGVWTTVWPFIAGFVITIWENIKSAIDIAINIVLGIIKAVMLLIKGDWKGAWEEIKATAIRVWDKMKEMIDNSINFIKDVVSIIWTWLQPKLKEAWEAIKTKTTEIWDSIKIKISEVVDAVKTKATEAWNSIKTKAAEAWEALKTKTNEAFGAIETKVNTAIGTVVSTISGLPGKLADLATQFYSQAVALGKSIVSGITDGISGFIASAKAAAKGAIGKAIDAAKAAVGFGSPATEFISIGASMIQGVIVGIKRELPRLARTIGSVYDLARISAKIQLGVPAVATNASIIGGNKPGASIYGPGGSGSRVAPASRAGGKIIIIGKIEMKGQYFGTKQERLDFVRGIKRELEVELRT